MLSSRPLKSVVPSTSVCHPDHFSLSSRPLKSVIPTAVEGSPPAGTKLTMLSGLSQGRCHAAKRSFGFAQDDKKNVATIQIDPGHTLAINQGPLMGAIIFRRREHLSERQRVVRTLKIMAPMGPIARVWPGSIRTQHSKPNTQHAKNKPRATNQSRTETPRSAI